MKVSRIIAVGLLAVAATVALVAQVTRQPQDEEYARLVKEWTTQPNFMSPLVDHLPKAPGSSAKVTDMVSAGGLLPEDRGYWTYVGSEVTPPCAEGVRWYVFEQDLSISREQFRAFSKLYKMNTRPMQDAHGRRIESNE